MNPDQLREALRRPDFSRWLPKAVSEINGYHPLYAKRFLEDKQLIGALHAIAAPEAEQGHWVPLQLLVAIGVRLTAAERMLLLQVLSGDRKLPPRPRGNQHDDPRREIAIAHYSVRCETKPKFADTQKELGVSRATVGRARKRFMKYFPTDNIRSKPRTK
jgi:hypothetical protein